MLSKKDLIKLLRALSVSHPTHGARLRSRLLDDDPLPAKIWTSLFSLVIEL
jgi:hypothetical protein